MQLKLLGIHHQDSNLEARERLAFGAEDHDTALSQLLQHPGVDEAWILSTCARVEVMIMGSMTQDQLQAWWLAFHGLAVSPAFYWHTGQDAVRHVLRVACGLDSALLGEPQILGQFKLATERSAHAGALGEGLRWLLPQVQRCAKGIRNRTELGRHSLSVAAHALRLAGKHLGDLGQAHALVIGAGEIIQSCLPYITQAGFKQLTFSNRSVEKAQSLAREHGGRALPMNDIPSLLADTDVVITATATPLPILGAGLVARATAGRQRPMVMVDLAVPRDIEAEVGDLPEVALYNMDDLHACCQLSQRQRQNQAQEAERLARDHAHHLLEEQRLARASHSIAHVRQHVEAMRDHCLNQAQKRLAAGQDPMDVLQCTVHQLTQALMHAPTQQLRQAAAQGDQARLQAICNLWVDEREAAV